MKICERVNGTQNLKKGKVQSIQDRKIQRPHHHSEPRNNEE